MGGVVSHVYGSIPPPVPEASSSGAAAAAAARVARADCTARTLRRAAPRALLCGRAALARRLGAKWPNLSAPAAPASREALCEAGWARGRCCRAGALWACSPASHLRLDSRGAVPPPRRASGARPLEQLLRLRLPAARANRRRKPRAAPGQPLAGRRRRRIRRRRRCRVRHARDGDGRHVRQRGELEHWPAARAPRGAARPAVPKMERLNYIPKPSRKRRVAQTWPPRAWGVGSGAGGAGRRRSCRA